MTTMPAVFESTTSCARVVTADGRELPLRATRLVVRGAGGLARVRLLQTFANPFAEPLSVTYQLPLPAEAAVAGFGFLLGERRVQGEIDRRETARERFEQALAEGRTAALLEQDRSALFTQQLGNLPPGAELQAEIEVDQPLLFRDGSWEWRFPTTVAPRYLGAPGRVADADRIVVDVADPAGPALPARCELDLVIADALVGEAAPQSPSHRLQVVAGAGGTTVCFQAPGGRVAMDRDVVVRWPAASAQVGVSLLATRSALPALAGQAFGLLSLLPPLAAGGPKRLPRDLIVLLDISGSMQGAPLAQAQSVTAALVGALDASDRLEMIAFASRQQAFADRPRAADEATRTAARQWLHGLRAGGGTEMHAAIVQALAGLRSDAQRQVVLITDGQIGFEREILGTIRAQLPAHTRVHVVGVGSAPNRSLTRSAARAGRGTEILIGLGEDPAAAIRELLRRTTAPLVDELVLSGSALVAARPQALPDLFGGAPARLALQLRPEGGTLHVRGTTAEGPFAHDLQVPPVGASSDEAVARWFAREAVEDLETELAATGDTARLHRAIEQFGLAHRISTVRTSWVAVTSEATVDPQAPVRQVRVAQELPHGMAVEGLGLRHGNLAMPMVGGHMLSADAGPQMSIARAAAPKAAMFPAAEQESSQPPVPPSAAPKKSFLQRLFGHDERKREEAAAPSPSGGVVGPGLPKRATLRLRTAAEWIFELTGGSAWQRPTRAAVVFADGSEWVLAIDPLRTTANGVLGAGAAARLVLQALAQVPAGAPVTLRLWFGDRPMDLPIA